MSNNFGGECHPFVIRHSSFALLLIHMNTVIACGGTGGHLFPGLAVAEVLRARGHEVMLFISEKEIEKARRCLR